MSISRSSASSCTRSERCRMNLEQYLLQSYVDKKYTVHAVGVGIADGVISFYIHPPGNPKRTMMFKVRGNTLITVQPEPAAAA